MNFVNSLKNFLSVILTASIITPSMPIFAETKTLPEHKNNINAAQNTFVSSENEIEVKLRLQLYGEPASVPVTYTLNIQNHTTLSEYVFNDEMSAIEKENSVTPMHLLAKHYFQTVLG